MAELTIDYDNLQDIIDSANTLAVKAESYYESLQNDVINSFGGVTAGVNDVLESAQYYVKAKKQQLADKANEYATFANNVGVLMAHAKQADLNVATKIENNQEDFLKNHSEIKAAEGIEAFLLNLFVEVKNANPLFEIVADIYVYAFDKLTDAWEQAKYEYRCNGGKEFWERVATGVIAVALVVVAVCTFIATFPLSATITLFGAIVEVAGCIGAAMGAINAIYDYRMACKAKEAIDGGDPAWAKIYSDTDTLSDTLRLENYKNKYLNIASELFADGWDITETACDVISIVDCGGKIFTNGKNLFNRFKDGSLYWDTLSKGVHFDLWFNNSPNRSMDIIELGLKNIKNMDQVKLFSKGITFKDRAKYLKTTANMFVDITKRGRALDELFYGERTFDSFMNKQFELTLSSSNNKNNPTKLYSKINKFTKANGTFEKFIKSNYLINMETYF